MSYRNPASPTGDELRAITLSADAARIAQREVWRDADDARDEDFRRWDRERDVFAAVAALVLVCVVVSVGTRSLVPAALPLFALVAQWLRVGRAYDAFRLTRSRCAVELAEFNRLADAYAAALDRDSAAFVEASKRETAP